MQLELRPQGSSNTLSLQLQREEASGVSMGLTLPIGLLHRILLYWGGF